jgi:hypothetical protein
VKRPAFQFYPADWRKDVELQSCSMAAQGLWINAMCLAHECEPYGHLTINGKAMTPAQLGRQVGLTGKEAESLLQELVDAGVARKGEDGTIFSSRMVRDEHLRNVRAEGGKAGSEFGQLGKEHGSKGGRPRKETGDKKPPLNPPPSSSSSSSPSGNNPLTPKGEDLPGFASFWQAWPVNDRKQAKGKCLEAWKKASAERDAALILAHVERMKASEDWRKQSGQFVPAPLVYLNQRRWEGTDLLPAGSSEFAGCI